MKQFFKFVFASCLGVVLSMVVLFFIGMAIVAGIAGSASEKKVSVDPNTVLHLTFNNPIPEQTNNLELNPFMFKTQDILGLNDIVESIKHAAGDEKIKGILLNLDNGLNTGVATASKLHDALTEFKESGKFIVAYSKYYTQGAYYLSSTADKIYVNPLGGIDFHGFAAIIPFFKNMLDKIGVKMQVFYAGDFKGATEPYRRNDLSEENRLQLREYLEPVFMNFLEDIGRARNKSAAELRQLADGLNVRTAQDAVTYGLADATGHLDDVLDDLKERMELKEKDNLKTVSLEDYARSFSKKKDYSAKDKIAIVYAEGPIYMHKGDRGIIGDNQYVKMLRKIRKDEKIKAIVMRVNSPGGSAIASENILRELNLAKQEGKKVVVSMGDYAASGGYYIACGADKIVAEENTLTGSIGVFSMLPNANRLFDEKLGISFDTVKTTRYSTGLNPFFGLAPEEEEYLQENTVDVYEKFLQRVAEGRNMSRDEVHKVAQGRIWTGEKAKEIGLVDEIGSLEKALETAAELAGLEKYRITEYPFQKDPIQELIDQLTGQEDEDAIRSRLIKEEMGDYYPYYRHVKEVMNMKGVQMRLPVFIDFR